MTPGEIKALRSRVSCQACDERELQERVAKVLTDHRIAFVREATIKPGCRADFFLRDTGTVIETKTKDSAAKVLRQLKTYTMGTPCVKRIMVLSRQPLNLPAQLSGKPIINCNNWKNFT
jgi:hypothetical protein